MREKKNLEIVASLEELRSVENFIRNYMLSSQRTSISRVIEVSFESTNAATEFTVITGDYL
jgi:hypothetical protein